MHSVCLIYAHPWDRGDMEFTISCLLTLQMLTNLVEICTIVLEKI